MSILFPGFKNNGETYDPIELVDVYQVLCHLLGIEPNDNDGVWARVKAFLRNSGCDVTASRVIVLASLVLSLSRNLFV